MSRHLNGAIRLLACVLIGTIGLLRLAHEGSAQSAEAESIGHADAIALNCSHAESSHSSHSDTPQRDAPTHDAEHCAVCHLLAVGSTSVMTDAPACVVVAPPVDRRVPPSVVEPHSAEVALPLSARAPPLA